MNIMHDNLVIYSSHSCFRSDYKGICLSILDLELNKIQYKYYGSQTHVIDKNKENEKIIFYMDADGLPMGIAHITDKNNETITSSFINLIDIGIIKVEKENNKSNKKTIIIDDRVTTYKNLKIDKF